LPIFKISPKSGRFIADTRNLWLNYVRPGREADHCLQLVPKSRIRGSIHALPLTSSWSRAQLHVQ
jgi:hypothetical protein